MEIKKDFEIIVVVMLVFIPVFILEHEKFFELIENYKQSTCEKQDNSLIKILSFEDSAWRKIKGNSSADDSKQTSLSFCESYNQLVTERDNVEITEEVKEVEAQQEKIEEDPLLSAPIKILIIGDSMILEGFGPQFENRLKSYEGFTTVRFGKYSTGLNRIDYFDWYSKTRELITSHNPDVLVIMVGANDGQGIRDSNGNAVLLNSESWDVVYRERVKNYLEEFSPKFKQIYWIGHPIPRTENFHNKFLRMNKIYDEVSQEYANVYYVNSWERFAVDGKYAPTLADDDGTVAYVKSSDGVHVTNHGGKILSDLTIDYMHQFIQFEGEDGIIVNIE